jgi:hypothetical protein
VTEVSSTRSAVSRQHRSPANCTRILLLLALGVLGPVAGTSAARATPLTVTGAALYYTNFGPVPPGFPGGGFAPGDYIAVSADTVIPNGDAATNTVGVATTGLATTTNVDTGNTITHTINFAPDPDNENQFYSAVSICTTACTPSGNNNPINLTNPWTLTFQNPNTTPTSVFKTLSLVGSEIGMPQNVTLSQTNGYPTFSWSAPGGADGYRILIIQNNVIGPGNGGQVVGKNLTTPTYTVNPADFTVPGYQLMPGITYTISLENLVTRNGSTTDLSNHNLSASSHVYSSFQIQPAGGPLINLPTFTLVGNQVVYGSQMTVQPGVTYYIDPAVATGYIYQIGSGNPNFASVELPNIGNPDPYDLYLWNGTAFVFDKTLAAQTPFDFADGGVKEFEVLGIDASLGLDPDNTTAFITALTFESAGPFTGTMTPITTNVSAPEPASLTLLASGLLGLGIIRRRRRPVSAQQKKRADAATLRLRV